MTIKFFVEWHGELAAGIRPGYEEVEIFLRYTDNLDEEQIEWWRDAVKEQFDGAIVRTEAEQKKYIADVDAMWAD